MLTLDFICFSISSTFFLNSSIWTLLDLSSALHFLSDHNQYLSISNTTDKNHLTMERKNTHFSAADPEHFKGRHKLKKDPEILKKGEGTRIKNIYNKSKKLSQKGCMSPPGPFPRFTPAFCCCCKILQRQ